MKKISILFILPDLEMGGAERIVTTIANHLPRSTFEPKILLLRKEGGYLEFLKDDVEIVDTKTPRIRHSLKPILKEIRNRKPDIVFSGFGEVNAYLAFFIKFFPKTKFIARETNVVSQHVTRKEIRFFYKFYNNYHKIICQSDDMQNDLIENFKIKKEKLIKINNPVDFDFINEKLQGLEKPESYSSDFRNIVAIGNLSPRKGFDNLLKVFFHLKNEKLLLHILGDGRDKELLHQMKKDLDLENVIFHGQQKNPYQFLIFADLFVLSSRYEGFPNVLLEAGACGTYSLANNCPGGITEIIQPKINGEICNIDNHQKFAEKILDILKESHDKVAIKSSIASRFAKDFILKKYEDVFLRIGKLKE
ncbi:glycosyltransferase [Chryseobacterium salivictor]|uniref:N-acetylgalactosamine-N, N'-diacetylbacillosaminyl-diphospho-undecaprenol 4-alpha-N-acetylgalactosaminyltransferase n=1 Tax=Chryseobacterium salivictor TaxID=2547600 RepID=A0A4P6ZH88_9FLAO|nr:glycosyltransferase [Chryseobacterium salivictor]QBO59091.1 N-acetylgalactosamine-N,N'-diacetylbacillosaminyl-diphospho-undecaprenol 4-alpha-N-acetylgalactosaminyltransferase [Chryseobacterium salivictor]